MSPQLGWSLPTADMLLYTPLFRFGYLEEMHLVPHGEVTKRWSIFVDKLFTSQNGFIGHKKTSLKSIRDQWYRRIESFKRLHGWEDGKTKNVSGLEGDLCELDATIKNILEEVNKVSETKKNIESDKPGAESNYKRKTKELASDDNTCSPSSRTSITSTLNSPSESFEVFNKNISKVSSVKRLDYNNGISYKKPKIAIETMAEQKLLDILGTFSVLEFMEYCLIPSTDQSTLDILNSLSIPVLINIHCSRGMNFNIQYVKGQLSDLGLNLLAVHKIYSCLYKLVFASLV